MSKRKKQWIFSSEKKTKAKPTDYEKSCVQTYFQPLIENFKQEFIKEIPNKEYNYLIDIYSKWYRSYFYLCQKYKSEQPDRLKDEFEAKFVRLTFLGNDKFDFSYFRHIGSWHLVAEDMTMEQCKEMILSNPNFQPIG